MAGGSGKGAGTVRINITGGVTARASRAAAGDVTGIGAGTVGSSGTCLITGLADTIVLSRASRIATDVGIGTANKAILTTITAGTDKFRRTELITANLVGGRIGKVKVRQLARD